jgi:hypothetical protein
MFLIARYINIFHAEFTATFMMYLNTFHILNFDVPSVTVIKRKDEHNFRAAAMLLFYILQKITLTKFHIIRTSIMEQVSSGFEVSDLYSAGTQFESQIGYWTSCLGRFVVFPNLSRKILGSHLKLDHDRFLLRALKFIIHHPIIDAT